MDIVIIGKRSQSRVEAPVNLYTGDSRAKANAAIDAAKGKFSFVAEFAGDPWRIYPMPPLETQVAADAEAPEIPVDLSKLKKKSK